MSNNEFSNNRRGICLSDTAGEIRNNTLTGERRRCNRQYEQIPRQIVRERGLRQRQKRDYADGTLTNAGDALLLEQNGLPYLVDSGTIVSASSTLPPKPNTVFKFKDRILQIFGTFLVRGPSLFTSVYDDSDGNDAYGDGASVGRAGLQEIRLESGSSSDITDAELRYFKRPAYTSSPLSLENVVFKNNTLGISANPAETDRKAINVTFSGNTATSTITLP